MQVGIQYKTACRDEIDFMGHTDRELLESNPYQSPSPNTDRAMTVDGNRHTWWKVVLGGILWAVVGSIPIAGFTALIFRFPVPFAGYMSGPSAIAPAMIASFFYGWLFGGYVILAMLGASVSILASRLRQSVWFMRLGCLFSATAYCFVLATLDWYIGPW